MELKKNPSIQNTKRESNGSCASISMAILYDTVTLISSHSYSKF